MFDVGVLQFEHIDCKVLFFYSPPPRPSVELTTEDLPLFDRAWGSSQGMSEAGEIAEGVESLSGGPLQQLAEFIDAEAIIDALLTLIPFL